MKIAEAKTLVGVPTHTHTDSLIKYKTNKKDSSRS